MGKEGLLSLDESSILKISSVKMNPQGRYCFVRGAKSNGLYFGKPKLTPHAKRRAMMWRHLRSLAFAVVLLGAVFVLDSLMLCVVQQIKFRGDPMAGAATGLEDVGEGHVEKETTELMMYGRLVNLASAALTKNESGIGQMALWEEPDRQASMWRPCAEERNYVDQCYNFS